MKTTPPLIAALLAATLLAAGCASNAPAPVDDRRPLRTPQPKPPTAQAAPAPGAAARPGTYVVKRGDTLYSIALEHGVDYHDLARWNRIDDPSKIRAGQELRVAAPEERAAAGVQVGSARLPGAIEARPLGAAAAAQPAADQGTKTWPKALRLPYSQANQALLAKSEAPPPAPAASQAPPAAAATAAPAPEARAAAPAAAAEAGTIQFSWPAHGKVIAGFSEPNNKGLDIAGKLGDPVYAAAPGRVMYTGTGIRGYGKLIVIKHEDGFNSVYAHNRAILVKEGQTVARGQRIAELGDTDADSPQLHFEIRKSGKPVDPARYLPPPS